MDGDRLDHVAVGKVDGEANGPVCVRHSVGARQRRRDLGPRGTKQIHRGAVAHRMARRIGEKCPRQDASRPRRRAMRERPLDQVRLRVAEPLHQVRSSASGRRAFVVSECRRLDSARRKRVGSAARRRPRGMREGYSRARPELGA